MRRSLMLLILMLALTAPAYAGKEDHPELNVGDTAPAFSLQGSDGKTYSLEELAGQAVVIAWFPKAFTGG